MNIHQNARLTLRGREEAVRRVSQLGHSARQVARALHTTDTTVRKWVARAAAGESLADRSSRPQHSPQATAPAVVLRIQVLRHQQRRTCREIAAQVAVSRATGARIVRRCGWARLHVLELPPTSRRYERAEPGELLHLDTKKLGRIVRPGHRLTGDRRDTVDGAGWEFGHMAVDDASRVALGEVLPDERGGTTAGFLQRTVRGLRRLGVRVAAVMTDNGAGYRSRRFRATCQRLGLRHLHLFTRPYTPRTNGNASSRPPCSSGLCRACAKALGFRSAKVGRPSSTVSSKKSSRVSSNKSRRRPAPRQTRSGVPQGDVGSL
jgi:transposase